MKKSVCVLFSILMVLACLLSGCDKGSDEFSMDYSTDMQIMYLCGGGSISVPMTKSDTGYYYVGEYSKSKRVLIYIDKESKKATPLCSKPNCMHDDVEVCDAYIQFSENVMIDTIFGAAGNLIQYYDGNLYILCGEYDESYINYNSYIMKMNLDGSNREKVTDNFDFAVMRWCIHRGYLYYLTDSSLMRIPMNSLKSEPEVLYESKYYIEDGQNTFEYLFAYKNYIYFLVDEKDDEGNGDGKLSFCINLDTMKKSDIKIDGEVAGVKAFSGDKVIFNIGNADSKTVEIADLDGSNGHVLFTQDVNSKQSFTFDGTYYYFDNKSKAAKNEGVEQVITVTNSNLEQIDTFRLPQIDLKVYNFFAPQDEDFFIFECFNENDEHVIVMADKSQIGSINGEVIQYTELCKLKWATKNSNGIYYTE